MFAIVLSTVRVDTTKGAINRDWLAKASLAGGAAATRGGIQRLLTDEAEKSKSWIVRRLSLPESEKGVPH
jgi:hypothetical protein